MKCIGVHVSFNLFIVCVFACACLFVHCAKEEEADTPSQASLSHTHTQGVRQIFWEGPTLMDALHHKINQQRDEILHRSIGYTYAAQ